MTYNFIIVLFTEQLFSFYTTRKISKNTYMRYVYVRVIWRERGIYKRYIDRWPIYHLYPKLQVYITEILPIPGSAEIN